MKVERSSETYHQMLLWLANLQDFDDLATKAYKRLFTETMSNDQPLALNA